MIDQTLGRAPNLFGVDAGDTKRRAGRRLGETELFAVRGRCPRQARDGCLAPQGATAVRNPRDPSFSTSPSAELRPAFGIFGAETR